MDTTNLQTVAVNVSTNPEMEPTASGTVTVAANLSFNPSLESATANSAGTTSGASWPGTWDTAVMFTGTRSLRSDRVADGVSTNLVGQMYVTPSSATHAHKVAVTPGLPYSMSAYVRASVTFRGRFHLTWRDSTGGIVAGSANPNIGPFVEDIPPNTWQRIVYENLVPPDGATHMYVSTSGYMPSGGVVVGGEQFWTDAVNINQGVMATPYYFDGDTPDDETFTYNWTGTAHESTSAKKGKTIPYYSFSRVHGVHDANGAARAIVHDVASSVSDAAQRVGTPSATALRPAATPGNTYHGSAQIWAGEGFGLGAFIARIVWRDAAGLQVSTTPTTIVTPADPLTPTRVTVQGQAPDGAVAFDAWFGLAANTMQPSGTIDRFDEFYVDKVIVGEGEFTGYFSGDTDPDDTYVYRWTGVPHASTSYRAMPVVGPGTRLGDWPIDLGDLALDRVDEHGGLWNVTEFAGRGSAPTSVEVTQRVRGHGAWIGGRYWQAKPYTISGAYEGDDAQARFAAEQRLLAAVGDLRDIPLRMHEETTRETTVVLNGELAIDLVNAYAFTFQVELIAPDPFRYSPESVTVTTGLPIQSGGRRWPASVSTRYNYVNNPRAGVDTTNANGYAGGETIARVTATTPIPDVTTAYRVTTTTGTGISLTLASSTLGETHTGSLYVRLISGTATGWKAAFTGTLAGSALTLTSDWQRVSLSAVRSNVTAGFGIRNDTANTGAVIEVTAALVEKATTLGSYFDGATPDTTAADYAWTGTEHASSSTRVETVGGATWPATWTGTSATGALVANNAGNAEAYPTFVVYGPLDDFVLSHPATGAVLSVDLAAAGVPLIAGEWIEVDMRRQRVTLRGTQSRRYAARGDFFALPPGESSVLFGSSTYNTTARAEMTYRATYL